jgi:hypothetical protein
MPTKKIHTASALVLGLLVLLGVISSAYQRRQKGEIFLIIPTEFNLTLFPGEHELTVRVTNRASVPRRIIGLAEG